jgi:uncharacterized membrane protein YhaH (DUF805 family)
MNARMGRLEYFTWYLAQIPIWLGLYLTICVTAGASASILGESVSDLPDTLWTYLALLVWFPMMLFFLVVIVPRRCHDRGESGWYALLLLIPFVNVVYGLTLLFGKGAIGHNQFGPQPPKRILFWSIEKAPRLSVGAPATDYKPFADIH